MTELLVIMAEVVVLGLVGYGFVKLMERGDEQAEEHL